MQGQFSPLFAGDALRRPKIGEKPRILVEKRFCGAKNVKNRPKFMFFARFCALFGISASPFSPADLFSALNWLSAGQFL